jgi:hypothetical protein
MVVVDGSGRPFDRHRDLGAMAVGDDHGGLVDRHRGAVAGDLLGRVVVVDTVVAP